MDAGTVIAIAIAPAGAEPPTPVASIRAVAGQGLAGDRYAEGRGTFSEKPGTGRQVTLIEAEAIEAASAELGQTLESPELRRNIVTRGIALNDLVGKEFQVGPVRLVGRRLCKPCKVACPDPAVKEAFAGRGGLRADILEDGEITVGDAVTPA